MKKKRADSKEGQTRRKVINDISILVTYRSGRWVESYKPLPKPIDKERKKRPCISCRKPFMSDWVGNRICPKCKRAQFRGRNTVPSHGDRKHNSSGFFDGQN
ncbi:MAG TPA: hypothetical protein VFR24_27685 [Candidatus Angelobacter sp.]|nr:hypothetical protein [Candidatus Angelobacter sp.]